MSAVSVMRARWRLLVLAVLVVAVAIPLTAAAGTDDDGDEDGRGSELVASLSGAREVPGPGDSDGRGSVELDLSGTKVCFELEWSGIAAPSAAHVHAGARDVAGPVAVLLFATDEGTSLPTTISAVEGCTTADASLVSKIRKSPGQYYVNVHNADFPDGAIRGQLGSE